MAELLHLFPDVLEESEALPASDEHDSEIGYGVVQEHGHGSSASDGMGAYIVREEAQAGFSNDSYHSSEFLQDSCGSEKG